MRDLAMGIENNNFLSNGIGIYSVAFVSCNVVGNVSHL